MAYDVGIPSPFLSPVAPGLRCRDISSWRVMSVFCLTFHILTSDRCSTRVESESSLSFCLPLS